MDNQERTRILEEAYDTIERAEREQAERAIEREQRAEYEPPQSYTKRQPERRERKRSEATEKAAAPEMDAATQARWDAWFDQRFAHAIQKRFEEFATILGEETAQREKLLMTEIKTLRAIVDELIVLRSSDTAKDITPLKVVHG